MPGAGFPGAAEKDHAMKTGLSINELAAKITANQALKYDLIVPTAETIMTVSDGRPQLISGDNSFPILPLAHRQIANHAEIPAAYYDRMRAHQPGLLASNVNTWFQANPQRRMLRTLGGDARAFLSDRYQRIENEEIAAAALPVLAELKGVKIVSSEVTEQRLYIHFVIDTIEGEVKKGDIVQAGGIISNSEVGLGSCSVSGLLWRLVCLNGMKTSDSFRRNHVGRKIEDSEALWADDTRKADDRAVLLKVRDMVRAVVDETRFKAQLIKMRELTHGKIESADYNRVVEVLAQKVGAAEATHGGILRSLVEGGDLTAWGLMNAITHQAHGAADYDKAVEFEAMGGRLLDLPATEWREILQAA
jgi:Domain of unknown function (DUF932)